MSSVEANEEAPTVRLADLLLAYARQSKLPNVEGYISAQIAARSAPKALQAPRHGSPLLSLPADVITRILDLLPPDAIRSLCSTSNALRDLAQPHLFARLRFTEYFRFLRLARAAVTDDADDWIRKGLTLCRSIHVSTICSNQQVDVRLASDDKAADPDTERDFINGEVEKALAQLLAKAQHVRVLRLDVCRSLSPSSQLASLVSESSVRELHVRDKCQMGKWACSVAVDTVQAGPSLPILEGGALTTVPLDALTVLEIEGIIHLKLVSNSSLEATADLDAFSPQLDELLTSVPSLTKLCLAFRPLSPKFDGRVVLSRLDKVLIKPLRTLDLEGCASATQQSLGDFLQRHESIKSLRLAGTNWPQRAELGDTVPPPILRRLGSYTVPKGSILKLPNLEEVDVCDNRLLAAILAGSPPRRVAAVHISLRDDNRLLPHHAAFRNETRSKTWEGEDPMPALSASQSVQELTLVIRGPTTASSWTSHSVRIFKQLPSSLVSLRIFVPELLQGQGMLDAFFPVSIQFGAMAHLIELRALTVPVEALFKDQADLVCRQRAYGFGMCCGEAQYKAQERCRKIVEDLAFHHPRLDVVNFKRADPGHLSGLAVAPKLDGATLAFEEDEPYVRAEVVRFAGVDVGAEVGDLRDVVPEGVEGRVEMMKRLPALRQFAHSLEEQLDMAAAYDTVQWGVADRTEEGESSSGPRRNPARSSRHKRKAVDTEESALIQVKKKKEGEDREFRIIVSNCHCVCRRA